MWQVGKPGVVLWEQVAEQGSDTVQAEVEGGEHGSLWWAQLDRNLKSAVQMRTKGPEVTPSCGNREGKKGLREADATFGVQNPENLTL